MSVVEQLKSGARQEVNAVVNFVTTPVGIFETVDRMVRIGRSTVRGVVQQAGVRPPGILQRFRLLRR